MSGPTYLGETGNWQRSLPSPYIKSGRPGERRVHWLLTGGAIPDNLLLKVKFVRLCAGAFTGARAKGIARLFKQAEVEHFSGRNREHPESTDAAVAVLAEGEVLRLAQRHDS